MSEPRVTIGVPVRNGEAFLSEALSALVAQTYRNLEILISDNASTDRTEAIGRSFAAADPRVRYERLPSDIGPAHNFNRLIGLAGGKYFKWAAHDDLHSPDYVERCVARLEAEPSAVLCQSRVRIIDAAGAALRDLPGAGETDSQTASVRFRSVLSDNHCHQIFGVIRLDALKGTRLIRPFPHGDGILLAELALRGKFVEEPGYLFRYRDHPAQSVKIARTTYQAYSVWFDPARRGRVSLPYWRRLREYLRIAVKAPVPLRERLRMAASLVRFARGLRLTLWWELTYAGNSFLGRR